MQKPNPSKLTPEERKKLETERQAREIFYRDSHRRGGRGNSGGKGRILR